MQNIVESIVREAGEIALNYFAQLRELKVDSKGHLDLVTIADRLTPDIARMRRYQELQALVNCTRRSLLPDPKCAACKWHFLCKGGCRRHREPFFNGNPGPNIFCEGFIDFFEYAYGRMKELAEKFQSESL